MNILTLCQRGNHRSVLTATILRDQLGYKDVIPAGAYSMSQETLVMLYDWADKILIMAEGITDKVHPEYQHKVIVMELGPDLWGLPFHRPFMEKAKEYLKEHGFYEPMG